MAIITIIGAGNGAHALAADCKLGGAEVRMFEFTQYNNKAKGILKSRRIRFEGIEKNYKHFERNGTAVIDMVTYDLAEAVKGANHILISMQAQGSESLYKRLAPLLEDGQTVSIFPDNYGSLILRRIMKERHIQTDVMIAGYSSLVYGARLTDYNNFNTETDVVNVTYRENEIRVETMPSSDFERYKKLSHEIPALDATDLIHGNTVLDIGLSNLNPIIHIPAVLMNVGAIENWGVVPKLGDKETYYDIYAYGASEGVGNAQYAYFQDLKRIAKAYGICIGEISESSLQSRMGPIGEMFYGQGYQQSFSEPLDQSVWLPTPKGAKFGLNSRYITEDVPIGCATALCFAKKLNVDTPILTAFLNIADIIMKSNYQKTGYNLTTLGMDQMSAEEMIQYMSTKQ